MTLLRRVVLIVLVALLPAFAAEIYNQRALRTAQRAELDDSAMREAGAVAAELGRTLDGTRNALVALSAMPAIQNEDGPACTALLRTIRSRFVAISLLALIGGDDRVVCSSAEPRSLIRPPGEWAQVRLARERGHFAAAGFLFGHWTQAPQLATGMPLPDHGEGAGSAAPVLIADVGLGWLGQQIRTLALQAGASITIADRHGIVLAGVPAGPAPGSALPASERELIAQGSDLARERGPDGGYRSLAIARLPDMTVLVRLDHSAAAMAQVQAAWRSYAMFAAGLAVALGCAFLLARRTILAPVEQMLRTIARWRAGDAFARVAIRDGHSEMGRIGAALNELLAAFERTESGLRAGQSVLEARVAERTRQLDAEVREREQAQALLQQAQKMEVIGQLTGGVAHDFNNLLTAIIGNLELAGRRSRDHADVSRLLAGAMRAADRGAALTQRMLAFGRRQYLQLQPIDICALLAGMDDLLRRSIGPTVTVRMAAAPGLWLARADANQLELVVLNLAINARDAMPEGGVLVIAADNEIVPDRKQHPARLVPGAYVRIRLHDDGGGMAPETLARVTEPFFTTKPAGKGSGLGLSMAHGVAAQSGGGLAIESQVGQGTTVSVWLPRAVREPAPPEASAPGAAITSHGAEPGLSILVVDDDAEVAEVTQECLEAAGYAVLRRADGETALALVDSPARIDLMIADLAMPGMNGVQLAARARARRPGLPVLLATGYAEAPAIREGDPGCPVLEKPFRAAQLLDAVSRLTRPADADRPPPGAVS